MQAAITIAYLIYASIGFLIVYFITGFLLEKRWINSKSRIVPTIVLCVLCILVILAIYLVIQL